MTITDIIGEGKPFEPPFKTNRYDDIMDKHGKVVMSVKSFRYLLNRFPDDETLGVTVVAQHICDLLNREHCEKENQRREWLSKCCDVVRNTNLSEDIKSHLINTFMRL